MGTRLSSPNPPPKLLRLEQKIHSHADTLLTRHIPDLIYAKGRFPTAYTKEAFQASRVGEAPQERDPANSVTAAWDAGMNDLNEVLRNA